MRLFCGDLASLLSLQASDLLPMWPFSAWLIIIRDINAKSEWSKSTAEGRYKDVFPYRNKILLFPNSSFFLSFLSCFLASALAFSFCWPTCLPVLCAYAFPGWLAGFPPSLHPLLQCRSLKGWLRSKLFNGFFLYI